MFIRDGQQFDVMAPHTLEDVQYPPGWFFDADERVKLNIVEVPQPQPPIVGANQRAVLVRFEQDANDKWQPKWAIEEISQEERDAIAAQLESAKQRKRLDINEWRAEANLSTFPHADKLVACDALSRSDIDAVANHISLFGEFPVNFPMGWKAVDNTYIPLPSIEDFKAMYSSMTSQGTANFARSQQLKATVEQATTAEQLNSVVWSSEA